MAARNVKNFEFKLGKFGLLLFSCSMAVLVFAVFVFGVKVGKDIDTYPEKYSRQIPAMIKGWLPWTKGDQRSKAGEGAAAPAKRDGPFDLTFYDTLAKKQSDGKISPAAGIGGDKPTGGGAAKVLVPPPNPPAEQKATAQSRLPAAAEPPVQAATTVDAPPQVKERYLIQVASYREKESAEGLCRKIRDLGYKPRVTEVTLPSRGRWFRVTIGGFENQTQAAKAAEQLPGKVGAVSCIVRRTAGE